jgi:hypothetical protein
VGIFIIRNWLFLPAFGHSIEVLVVVGIGVVFGYNEVMSIGGSFFGSKNRPNV